MFEKFSNLTKKLRERSNDKTGEHNEAVQIMNEELADATIEAEDLSSRVKDILDELSILEATVQYQQDVQRAMKKQDAQKAMKKQDAQGAVRRQNVLETDLTTTYILNDIKGLGSVAQRVHAAVSAKFGVYEVLFLTHGYFRSTLHCRYSKAKLQIYKQSSRSSMQNLQHGRAECSWSLLS